MDVNTLSNVIIGLAMDVHKELGPGLLESSYEECLCYELADKGIALERQKRLPVNYKSRTLDAGYKVDILVDDVIILN